MKRTDRPAAAILLAAALLAPYSAAHAASASTVVMADALYAMCLNAANAPRPHGEWDLKGNPKLPKYCDCLAPQLVEHGSAVRKFREHNPGQAESEQLNKQELALRNTCRKQLGLAPAQK